MKLDKQTLEYIEILYKKEAKLLFHYSRILFDNSSIAEESVQETFIIACINSEKLLKSQNPEGWIMNTHKNVCRNIKKSRNLYLKHFLSLDDSIPAISNIESEIEITDDLSSVVTPSDFVILKKIILDGYSHKDLAEELNISVDSCKKRFQRAKEHFRKNFQQTDL